MSHQLVLVVAVVYAALGVFRAFSAGPDRWAQVCWVCANVWAAAYVIS